MTGPSNAPAAASTKPLSFGARLRQLAQARPAEIAVTELGKDGRITHATWADLDREVDRLGQVFADRGVGQCDVVAIALNNGLFHVTAVLAAWRVGATVVTLDPDVPRAKAGLLLERAGARIVLSTRQIADGAANVDPGVLSAQMERLGGVRTADRISCPGKLVLSGGSTGLPKLMSDGQPWERVPGRSWGNIAPSLGFRPDQIQLVCAAMSHNAPLTWAHIGLFEGHRLVIMERFDAAQALSAIDRYGINFVMLVPTMMVRMLDALRRVETSFGSLEALYHTAAPCPVWLKRQWIDRLGADRVFEMYGSGEGAGQTIIDGNDWLAHPGSVGRPFETDIQVRGPDGTVVATNGVGELFLRPWNAEGMMRKVNGQPMPTDAEGFISIGDMGRIDAEGYVYLCGRRDDVIVTGGLKVHPEAVESAILSHPSVRDAVVVGAPDRTWGERVHAFVELSPGKTLDLDALRTHCSSRLSSYELPKSLTILEHLPRDGFGKIQRKAVRSMLADGALSPAG